MIKGTTSSGFDFEVNEKVVTGDYRFTRTLARMKKAGPGEAIVLGDTAISMLLDDDQQEKLFEHLEEKSPDHLASNGAVTREFTEIIQIAAEKSEEIKNS